MDIFVIKASILSLKVNLNVSIFLTGNGTLQSIKDIRVTYRSTKTHQ